MNEEYKKLLKAPWSNQKVGILVRFFAWIYVLCGIFALSAAIYFSIKEGIAKDHILFIAGMFTLVPYSIVLFGHVAIKGRAPAGWLPW